MNHLKLKKLPAALCLGTIIVIAGCHKKVVPPTPPSPPPPPPAASTASITVNPAAIQQGQIRHPLLDNRQRHLRLHRRARQRRAQRVAARRTHLLHFLHYPRHRPGRLRAGIHPNHRHRSTARTTASTSLHDRRTALRAEHARCLLRLRQSQPAHSGLVRRRRRRRLPARAPRHEDRHRWTL